MVAPFALATVADGTAERPALVVDLDGDPTWRDLSDLGPTVHALLQDWDSVLRTLRTLTGQATRPLEQEQLRQPFVPGQVLQAGANYRSTSSSSRSSTLPATGPSPRCGPRPRRRWSAAPPTASRTCSSACPRPSPALTTTSCSPPTAQQHDWELELAVVIGREAFRVDREQALEHVAGYTIANDLTTRDLVFRRDMPAIGTDWYRAKNAPGFTPLGPYLVPAEFVRPEHLRIRLELNGEVMQDESTKDMIFDVAAIVAAASRRPRCAPATCCSPAARRATASPTAGCCARATS